MQFLQMIHQEQEDFFLKKKGGTRRLFFKKKGGTRRLNKHRCRDTGVMENTAYW
jgi:hypothetical protein